MADKIYVGGGKQIKDYDMYSISLCLSDIPKEAVSEFQGKKYVKLVFSKMKKPQEYEGKIKKTHSLAIDDYKPDSTKQETKQETAFTEDDLPFSPDGY